MVLVLANIMIMRQQIIDLLALDKSQYFAQPRPIIDSYLMKS